MILSKLRPLCQHTGLRSMSEHRTFPLQPTRWQWTRFKDWFHFYIMLGVIPLGLITLGANIFVGPATLTEIPEDYVPKHWEYYKSPITRFIARYILTNPQQEYEKYLSYLFIENEKRVMRIVGRQIKSKIKERHDYPMYYYWKDLNKYVRAQHEGYEDMKSTEVD